MRCVTGQLDIAVENGICRSDVLLRSVRADRRWFSGFLEKVEEGIPYANRRLRFRPEG
jgi:hypothetical protein